MPFFSNDPNVMEKNRIMSCNKQPIKHQAKNEIDNCNVSHIIYDQTTMNGNKTNPEERGAKTEVNELTHKLCEACRHLERNGLIYRISGELKSWWSNHRKSDRKQRRFKEDSSTDGKLRKKALKKLTSEELRVLGI